MDRVAWWVTVMGSKNPVHPQEGGPHYTSSSPRGSHVRAFRETVAVTEQHDEGEKAISPLFPERFFFISLPVSCLKTP